MLAQRIRQAYDQVAAAYAAWQAAEPPAEPIPFAEQLLARLPLEALLLDLDCGPGASRPR